MHTNSRLIKELNVKGKVLADNIIFMILKQKNFLRYKEITQTFCLSHNTIKNKNTTHELKVSSIHITEKELVTRIC